jgi:hypothetical protein
MSDSYYLVCMECKAGIHLGKTVNTRYKDIDSDTYGFSTLGHTTENGVRVVDLILFNCSLNN